MIQMKINIIMTEAWFSCGVDIQSANSFVQRNLIWAYTHTYDMRCRTHMIKKINKRNATGDRCNKLNNIIYNE